MRTIGTITMLLSLLCVPVTGSAEQQPTTAEAKAVVGWIFDRLDCDFDGVIDVGEVEEHLSQIWHTANVDGSPGLSPSEYATTHAPLDEIGARRLFLNADADSDGEVGYFELGRQIERLIRQLDLDGDQELSRSDTDGPAQGSPQPARHDHAHDEDGHS